MIRVMIVDDDIDTAESLRLNIDGQDGISVTAILSNGAEAVERCLDIRPDIILMDAKMPGMSGIEACRLIKLKATDIKVLILTFYQVKENEINAVKYGCDGYLYKGHKSEEIIAIIKSTCGGFKIYEDGVRNTIQDQMASKDLNGVVRNQLDKLTQREIEIVRLITTGKTNIKIAEELHFSEGYIRNQISIILGKLRLTNSKELAVWGAKVGL